LNSSSLFNSRLADPKNAVREFWELSTAEKKETDFWSTYILIAPVTNVQELLKQEKKVYLTQVNTPKERIIAGERKVVYE
jgi:hypothetical protein